MTVTLTIHLLGKTGDERGDLGPCPGEPSICLPKYLRCTRALAEIKAPFSAGFPGHRRNPEKSVTHPGALVSGHLTTCLPWPVGFWSRKNFKF